MTTQRTSDSPFSDPSRWLLVTDVDDTLVGDDAALQRFVDRLSSARAVAYALNSSRPIASVRKTLAALPVAVSPVAIIGAMGTEIEIDGVRCDVWSARFTAFDRQPVDDAMLALGAAAHDDEFQTAFKASFAVPEELQAAAASVVTEQMPASRIVVSGATDFDVVPCEAGKGAATLFLAEQLNIDIERLIVAGDSANDLAMFDVAQRGIVVGNARDELKGAVERDGVYFATEHRADGLLEGLDAHGALQ